mgnify:FL=1|jgi:hypothetical protein
MERAIRIVYLSTAIMGFIGAVLALVTDDISEFAAWTSVVAMAGAGFIKEVDEEQN